MDGESTTDAAQDGESGTARQPRQATRLPDDPISASLRAFFGRMAEEETPERLRRLLDRLAAAETAGERRA